jgi:predicted transposase YbfD/YdcC
VACADASHRTAPHRTAPHRTSTAQSRTEAAPRLFVAKHRAARGAARHRYLSAGAPSRFGSTKPPLNPARFNEVAAFAAALVTLPELAGVLVTADALHCQRAHADFLATHAGHYLFTVKGNQPLLRQALMRLPWAQAPGTRRRGTGHGRTESRSIKVIDLDGTPAQDPFPHARRAIKVVRRRRVGAGQTSVEIVYEVTSLDHRAADSRLLGHWLQGHWAIENNVHRVREVTPREDASRIRVGAGPQLMAALRNTATNIARLDGHTNIAAAQRTAAWSPTAITDARNTA